MITSIKLKVKKRRDKEIKPGYNVEFGLLPTLHSTNCLQSRTSHTALLITESMLQKAYTNLNHKHYHKFNSHSITQ